MKALRVVLTTALMGLLFGAASVVAQQPMINYQGRLALDTGWPVTDNVSIVFCIYAQATGGVPVWSETHSSVGVQSGIYNVLLGSVNPIPGDVFDGGDRWLGIKVNDDSEMSPRQRIASVGYAINSDMVDGKHASDFLDASSDWGRPGVVTDLYEGTRTLSDKYINADGPELIRGQLRVERLELDEEQFRTALSAWIKAGQYAAAVNGYSYNDYGWGVHGSAPGSYGRGVSGYASGPYGNGVCGMAQDPKGIGGFFRSYYGVGLFALGGGQVGSLPDGSQEAGYFIGDVTVKNGDVEVAGLVNSTSGGFKFPDGSVQTSAYGGGGVNSYLSAGDGSPKYALWVDDDGRIGVPTKYSIDGNAVRLSVEEDVWDHYALYVKHINDTKGHGLRIGSNGGNWDDKLLNVIRDVNEDNESIMCVKGDGTTFLGWTQWTDDDGNYTNKSSDLGKTCLAVNGHIHCKSLTNEYEASFENLVIQGVLFAAGKAFKIDHPSDPANKYLIHSCVESPDMMNVYNGNVVLDNSGYAWVELPGYFETLNRDFRYQLTPVGAPGPNLHIAEEISQNRFKIGGGEPGMKVSWQVTGVRKDPFAVQYKQPVELDKPVDERGKYLRPELYGMPETMKIDVSKRFQGTKPTIAKSAVAKPEVKEMEE